MSKKVRLLFCCLLALVLCFNGIVMAADTEEAPISVVIDEKAVDFGADQTPVLADSGRTLVPMRKIFETLGAKIQWEDSTSTVTATKDDITIVLKIGDQIAKKNDTEVSLDQPAVILNDRTLVPIRFVGEALGAQVDWDSESNKVIITTVKAENTPDDQGANTDKKALKVLAVGNSFSEDAAKYLHDIAAADGVDLTIANLYIGGCSLQTHWQKASANAADYDYQLNGTAMNKKVSIKETLESDDWDYVTLQQASPDSGLEEKYYPYVEDLAKYIKSLEPEATLLIHQTWAYEKGSTHSGFNNYNKDQTTMFNAIISAYDSAAKKVGLLTTDDGKDISKDKEPLKIIPCGEAFQNARANPIFDTTMGDGKTIRLNRDGYHASLTYGRYLLGAVWYECLTGNKIEANIFSPAGVEKSELDLLKKAAHEAVVKYGW